MRAQQWARCGAWNSSSRKRSLPYNKAMDADAALQELGSDLIGEAYVTATVTVWDEDPLTADEKLRLVEKVIQGRDFTRIAETVNAVEAWLGSLPGHVYANVRLPPVSTLNLAHMMPLSAVWAEPECNEHLDGPPLLFAKTEGATPFRLSLHVGDVGHTLVVGPTGAGKSVLLALMALQFRRYARSRVFAFDFGGSIRAAALAMGGDWHDLGGALSDDATEPVALQPLAAVDDAAERAWAAEWIAAILSREGVTVTPESKDHLWSALTSLASAPVGERTLTGLSVLLQSAALKQALAPYCVGGPWGRLLDAEAERLGQADVQAFETEGLIGTEAASAVLAYLFHRIEGRLDGSPTLIVDEGWLALDDPTFGAQLREWLKTLRKKNASVVFATQSLADIETSAIAPAIIESCPTRLFLPNERAIEPQILGSIAASGSTIARSRSWPGERRSATTTASPAAAIACSSWASATSRSPSRRHLPRPTRPPSRTCWRPMVVRSLPSLAASQRPRMGSGVARAPTSVSRQYRNGIFRGGPMTPSAPHPRLLTTVAIIEMRPARGRPGFAALANPAREHRVLRSFRKVTAHAAR
jgi:type IV secretion/conjugal transfer VirB4 family ATPase